MAQSTAFAPIWPPIDDDAAFAAMPEVRRARRLYQGQKDRLVALCARVARLKDGADTNKLACEIATLLHNISGTAAYFGERGFGHQASALEQPVRAAFTAELLRPLGAEIAASLDAA